MIPNEIYFLTQSSTSWRLASQKKLPFVTSHTCAYQGVWNAAYTLNEWHHKVVPNLQSANIMLETWNLGLMQRSICRFEQRPVDTC